MKQDQEIFVHVGFPKTATTWLQKEVFPMMDDVNLVPHNGRNILREDIEHGLRPGKNILSNENLIGMMMGSQHFPRRQIIAHQLRDVFGNAKILFTVRRQYDAAISWYSEALKQGVRAPFESFILYHNGMLHQRKTMENGGSFISLHPDNLDYAKIITVYMDLFGKENVSVLPYEMLVEEPHQFLSRVCSWLGGVSCKARNTIHNRRIGGRQMVLLRWANMFLRSDYQEHTFPPFSWLPFGSRECYRFLQMRTGFLGNATPRNDAVSAAFDAYYEECNRWLNRLWSGMWHY